MSLERGLTDAGILGWNGIHWEFRWSEVTKYRTIFPRGIWSTHMVCAMNQDAWNSLPSEVQKIFEETTGLEQSRKAGEAFDIGDRENLQKIMDFDKEKGNPPVYQLPDAERERWRQALRPLYEEWIAENEAMGLPARELFKDLLKAAEKYNP